MLGPLPLATGSASLRRKSLTDLTGRLGNRYIMGVKCILRIGYTPMKAAENRKLCALSLLKNGIRRKSQFCKRIG